MKERQDPALFTTIGPMIEWGPLPGLLTRSFANVSSGTPGCNSSGERR